MNAKLVPSLTEAK